MQNSARASRKRASNKRKMEKKHKKNVSVSQFLHPQGARWLVLLENDKTKKINVANLFSWIDIYHNCCINVY